MRYVIILFSVIFSIQCYSQIGIDMRIKNNGDKISIVIKDSSDYVKLEKDSSPSSFEMVFVNDTLSNLKFNYQVFGFVQKPQEPKVEKYEATLVRNGNNIMLQLDYFNSYYGDKFYVLNGVLSKPNANGEQIFTPTGVNVVQSKTYMKIYTITRKGLTKKGIELRQ